jgi:hypothetical protein
MTAAQTDGLEVAGSLVICADLVDELCRNQRAGER